MNESAALRPHRAIVTRSAVLALTVAVAIGIMTLIGIDQVIPIR